MKLSPLFLILIFILPFSSASIEITSQLDDKYNLGDNIPFSLKLTPDITASTLVKLTLKCTDKELIYYIVPINLQEGKETNIDAPTIKAFSGGVCNILANVGSLEGKNIDEIISKDFVISHLLELSFNLDKTEALPGDTITIKGMVEKQKGDIKDGTIVITLDNKKEQIGLDGKEFRYNLELDNNIRSGEHIITLKVNDSYGNFKEESTTINIKAIPTKLEFNINKKEFKPKETLQLMANLLDQANDPINGHIKIKLFKEKTLFKKEIIIFDTQIESDKEFGFTFEYDIAPGGYILKSVFDNLEKEDTINILPHQEIKMRLEGDTIFVKNIGNIRYDNETTIMLEKENRTYVINKKIRLDVGEETAIDISKELPSGNYTVELPSETLEEGIIIKNIEVEDNRSLYKKGLDMITGNVVASLPLSGSKLASFIIIILILSTIGYFNRERIKRIIEKIREKRSGKL